jgi:hypothetical protein
LEDELAVGQDAMPSLRGFYPEGQQLLFDLWRRSLAAKARSKDAASSLDDIPSRCGPSDPFKPADQI